MFVVDDSNRERIISDHAKELVDQMGLDELGHYAREAIMCDLQTNDNEELTANLSEYYGLKTCEIIFNIVEEGHDPS